MAVRKRAGVAAAAAVAWIAVWACAAPPVDVRVTGPASNRVKVFFLGDGYTAGQLDTVYPQHVQAMVSHLFNNGQDPYPRYRNFFNVYRVNVASNQSGADVPPAGVFRDTALDARYYYDGTTERLMYINDAKADAALNASTQGTGLTADVRYVTVNDTRYGGAGGKYATFAGGNGSATEIALHESAHSWNKLADEYGGSPGPYNGAEPREINVSKSPTGEKWSHWLGYEQPGIGVIGAYEGARYFEKGLYRPSANSKMRTLWWPFDAVSREKIILDIYSIVRPLDGFLPTDDPVYDPAAFWVDLVDPAVLSVEWMVDGSVVGGGNGGNV